jgi:hypothetical protein
VARVPLYLALALVISASVLAASAEAAPGDPDSSQADTSATPGLAPEALLIPQTPPDFPRVRIAGEAFFDYYYNASGDPRHAYNATGADSGQAYIDGVKPITKDLNGVQLRRVYFTFDDDFSPVFGTRFRLEADSKSLTSDGKIGVLVKNAFVQIKNLYAVRDSFQIGLIPTPTFENSEVFWQYRSIERTIADFRGLASSTDLGVALKGFVDPEYHLGYSLMVGAGTGQKPETDRNKRIYFSLPVRTGALRLEPYYDYQVVRVTPAAINNDQAMYKVFAGYELKRTAFGVEALARVLHKGAAATQEQRGVSAFVRQVVDPKLSAVVRFDNWIPDHRSANRVDQQFYIGALDWQPFKDVHAASTLELLHLEPTVEWLHYAEKGTAIAPPHDDVQVRMTFFYRFNKPLS